MTREELFQMVELLRDTAKLHQPNEEILTDVKAESFVFVMESVLSALSVLEKEEETLGKMRDEIIQDIWNGVIQVTKGSKRLFEIIDKHIGSVKE